MVEDVVAWLPHSPMLAFDILPSYGCLLASCATPPSSWAMEDDLSYIIFLFNLVRRYKKSFL
jgi:hypothetical protein